MQSLQELLRNAPAPIQEILVSSSIKPLTGGKSGSGVWKIEPKLDRPTQVLKVGTAHHEKLIAMEAERLSWLNSRFPSPLFRGCWQNAFGRWLLMDEVKGENAKLLLQRQPNNQKLVVTLVCEALRRLHSLPIADCPFNATIDVRLEQARQELEMGRVDETDFDLSRKGQKASTLYEDLLATRPIHEDQVVCHGDATPANFIIDLATRSVSMIDVPRLGKSDKYQDIALMIRSLSGQDNALTKQFLTVYGLAEIDQGKTDFYQLLDEFF